MIPNANWCKRHIQKYYNSDKKKKRLSNKYLCLITGSIPTVGSSSIIILESWNNATPNDNLLCSPPLKLHKKVTTINFNPKKKNIKNPTRSCHHKVQYFISCYIVKLSKVHSLNYFLIIIADHMMTFDHICNLILYRGTYLKVESTTFHHRK